MWTTEYIISQVCVFVAVLLLASTYISKNKKFVLGMACLSSVFFMLHYFLLSSYTGAITNIIAIVRCVWLYIDEKRGKENNKVALYVLLSLMLIGGIVTFMVWYDIFAIMASLVFTYGIWQKNIGVYRLTAIFNSCCYITYSILLLSIVSICTECVLLTSSIIGIIRWYKIDKFKLNNMENQKSEKSLEKRENN